VGSAIADSCHNPQSMFMGLFPSSALVDLRVRGILVFALSCITCLMLLPQQGSAHHQFHLPPLPATACVSAISSGEVSAGGNFSEPLGGGLDILLDPTPTGWVLRVLPGTGIHPPHDYAELATPPYQSVNPLLITTDFSFRAQDVIGWNPRHFQFYARPSQASAAQHAYDDYFAHPKDMKIMQRLAELPQYAASGDFTVLDSRLLPGTGNQSPAAAVVAAHFQTTPHTLLQAPANQASPLGRVVWMRFQLSLLLPKGFAVATAWQVDRSRCPR